eukprot:TRINITY_DN4142_c0_g1_i3.p1 TRINITY_DN4142_c0_g1~~TRINITY_DN4142_c0_g1_i3.p1  ORF type:complete len:887 (+),score=187.45 TRINITY_DN4142_c0_g1_i3:40-2700(+)
MLSSFLANITEAEWTENRWKFITFPCVFVVDLLVTLFLYAGVTQWEASAWSPDEFFGGLTASAYHSSATEVVLMWFVRVALVPVLIVIAVNKSSLKTKPQAETEESDNKLTDDLDLDMTRNNKVGTEHAPGNSDVERKKIMKKVLISAVFLLLTACEVVIGVKSILLRFEDPEASYFFSAFIMWSAVMIINIELYLTNDIINLLTREEGILFPHLHAHPLFYNNEAVGHWCDFCRSRGLREAYRCNTCDYDLCIPCTKKKSKAGSEGVLRTDSGVIEEVELSNWEYMKRAYTFVKPHVLVIIVAMVFLTATAAANLLIPNFQGKLFDDVIKLDREAFKSDIVKFLVISLLMGVFGSIRNLCFLLSARRITNVIRNQLYCAILRQDIAFFDGTSTGDLTSRLGQNTNAVVDPIQSMLNTLLSSLIKLGGGLVMCLLTSWRLSILSFTTIGPITLIVREYSDWARIISKKIWTSMGDSQTLATEAVTNIRTVRAFGREPKEIEKYREVIGEALEKGEKDAYVNVGTFAITSYLDMGITVLMLWYGGVVAMDEPDVLSVGKLITFQLYWNMMNNSFTNITDVWNSFTKAGGAAQRIMSILDLQPDIGNEGGLPVNKVEGHIELKDVGFSYQMRTEKVLDGINIDIPAGSVCALVGRSGCGKSTLINLLLRFYDPKSGGIYLDGTNIKELNPIAYRRNIGIVSQDTELFNGTIEENIAYGVDEYTQRDLIKAAKQANAHDFILSFDEGYSSRVGSRGMRLSGGQKQRIALARVFLRRPKLLFLDEATSALDAESEGEVQDAIDRLIGKGGCTVILVAHRLSTVVNANKICVIHAGRVLEQGNHEELLALQGVYSKLVAKQLSRMNNDMESKDKDGSSALDVIDALIDEVK